MDENPYKSPESGEQATGKIEPIPIESPKTARGVRILIAPFVLCVGMVAIEVLNFGFSTAVIGVAIAAGLTYSLAVFIQWIRTKAN